MMVVSLISYIEYSPCEIHKRIVLGPTGKAQQGAFIPQCLDSGVYDRVQCDGSSSYCWCVDDNGFEEPGTREFGRPNCDEKGKEKMLLIAIICLTA